ncbi:MAG TPA: pyruvate, water dikinase, partial [Bacteroidetes bacterium]|nr:pyruvate, water dikinase [Bacteroidota bacterium]
HNNLWGKIQAILQKSGGSEDRNSAAEKVEMIEALFHRAEIPSALRKEIQRELKNLFKRRKKKVRLAVRSSAVGEDSELRSYAGQFRSLLNVPADQVPEAYKKIIAGRFINLPFPEKCNSEYLREKTPMAVGVQEMIPAAMSGIAYSNDPTNPPCNCIIISSVYGLGAPLAAGQMNADFYRVSRLNPAAILEKKRVEKSKMMIPLSGGGVDLVAVPAEKQKEFSLTDEHVRQIAEIAFVLERSLQRSQDIEWAIDSKNQVYVLQSRPLALKSGAGKKPQLKLAAIKKYPVLLQGRGVIANRGIAAGQVCKVTEDVEPALFPVGAIAVARHASPRLSKIIRKTAAILTETGSSTGHMATIAREFGVPTIVGAGDVNSVLQDGMEITVDAQENVVYRGVIPELLEFERENEDVFIEMPEYRILRRMLKMLLPLNLTDPSGSNFQAKNCKTYHDIIRFAHEKAVQELINLNISAKRFPDITVRDLKLILPIGLKVIDIGNGVAKIDGKQNQVTIDEITSIPMKAVLIGLTAPNIWSTKPVDLGFGDFMSSITRFSMSDDKLSYQGQNLAVISKNYLNLSLRLGYHFNVIDTYLSANLNDNYIYFRFVGGVTDNVRRHRRAVVIQSILEKEDFVVSIEGDLVIAKVKNRSQQELEATLNTIGKLIGFTRQLDAKMQTDEAVQYYVDAFQNMFRGGS